MLENEQHVVVGWELGILEVLPTAEEDRAVGYLDPTCWASDWEAATAVENLRGHPDQPIAVALLDQRNLAGPRQRVRQRAVLPAPAYCPPAWSPRCPTSNGPSRSRTS